MRNVLIDPVQARLGLLTHGQVDQRHLLGSFVDIQGLKRRPERTDQMPAKMRDNKVYTTKALRIKAV